MFNPHEQTLKDGFEVRTDFGLVCGVTEKGTEHSPICSV
jgi:hypothetical protein